MGLLALPLAGLAACGPPSGRLVADQCEERVRASGAAISGTAGIGVGSEGFISDLDVNLTLAGSTAPRSDPRRSYARCVRERTGEGPVRPLRLE